MLKNESRKLTFLYSPEYKTTGSTIMRGKQLSELAQNNLGRKWSVSYSPLSKNFKDSVLFFTKGAIYSVEEKTLSTLSKYNKLLFDMVDGPILENKIKYADIVIAASRTAYSHYLEVIPSKQIHVLDHHVDPRVKKLKFNKKFAFTSIGYFGELENTIYSDNIKKYVNFITVDTVKQRSKWLNELENYNVHYALRNKDNKRFKPFLKGFTAAHCYSNVIASENDSEAIFWLGKDYPYLIPYNANEEQIVHNLNLIKGGYGSREWNRGLKIMANIRDNTSDKCVLEQLKSMLRTIN